MPASIIVPVYARTQDDVNKLYRCLDSCIYQSDDVVVWNDGSTVDLSDVHRSYPEVHLLGDSHRGKSFARNSAVRAARYEFLYPVDADDWIRNDTLDVLLSRWDGKPLYSDLMLVHGEKVQEPYVLLPFDCSTCLQKSIASVNVLHTKAQWEEVGGWNENLNLYEDWLYNSCLFWTFCADKVNIPLVYYRQHGGQSTRIASKEELGQARRKVDAYIRQFIHRRTDMAGCCGGKRSGKSASAAAASASVQMMSAPTSHPSVANIDLSLEADLRSMGNPNPGYVWAKYLGGRGMMEHGRRGHGSRKKYKVQYGGTYQVKSEDAVSRQAFQNGQPNCGFVLLEQTPIPEPPAPVQRAPVRKDDSVADTQPVPPTVRSPVRTVEREPVLKTEVEEAIKELDMLSIKELRAFVEGLELEDVQLLLTAEKSGKNRTGAVKLLEKALQKQSTGG